MSATPTHRRLEVTFPSGDAHCAAWLYLPEGCAQPPVVVLGHGLGATRELRLDAYGERFAQAGIAALAFTYRNFGDSGGSDRQLLSVRQQLADWDAALGHVQTRTDVDTARVAVWGSSFGGGHVIRVAARHPELAAVVSQCPFTDGLWSAWRLGVPTALRSLPLVLGDAVSAVTGRAPVLVPVVGDPGSVALMNAPDALDGYLALVPEGTGFVNGVRARAAVSILAYRPGLAARRVTSPVLFCVSSTDTVAPAARTVRLARRAPRHQIELFEAGHFDFYLSPHVEEIVETQVDFLRRHLGLVEPDQDDRAGS